MKRGLNACIAEVYPATLGGIAVKVRGLAQGFSAARPK